MAFFEFFQPRKDFLAFIQELQWPVPIDVFYALAEKTIFPSVDLAILNKRGAYPEILLTKRPSSDRFFAGLWHVPGAIVIPGDTALSTLQKRVLKPDVGVSFSGEPEFVLARDILMGPAGYNTSPRGQEAYRLFQYVLQDDDPEVPVDGVERMLCPLGQLPDAFVQHQMPSIERLRAIHGV